MGNRSPRCRSCEDLFTPDYRHKKNQKFCSKELCRKAAKKDNQRRWWKKPANRDVFKGAENVFRVQEWRKKNPGYWRKKPPNGSALQDPCSLGQTENKDLTPAYNQTALQDRCSTQDAFTIGLISLLTGDTLQDPIAATLEKLSTRGLEILGKTPRFKPSEGEDNDKTHTFKPKTPAKDPLPV